MNPNLKITLSVDDKGSVEIKKFGNLAQSSLHKTELSFKDLNKAMMASANRLSTLTKGLVGLGAAVGGLYGIKRLADGFMDTAKSFEAMEIKLNALTRGRGAETLEKINAWALTMPVNTQKAVDTFVMMQAMGLDPTIAKMQTLVDVSSIFGEEAMPRVARALGQMQTLGKLSAEELNQLAEAGINARKYLTRAFGQTVEELQKSGTDIDKIVKAIMDGMQAEFGGASQMAMNTWSGMMTTLISYWEEFKKTVMDAGVFDTVKQFLSDALEGIKRLKTEGQLKEWAEQIASDLKKVADALHSIAKVAGLRSIMDTMRRGAELAEQGKIDWDKFRFAGFFERQEMVDAAEKGYGKVRMAIAKMIGEIKTADRETQTLAKTTQVLDEVADDRRGHPTP